MPDFLAAAKDAKRRGLPALEKIFRDMADLAVRTAPIPHDGKPRIRWIFDTYGWCGQRLNLELSKALPEFDCQVVPVGSRDHLRLDADIYIYRRPAWLTANPLPDWMCKRVICIVEAQRLFETDEKDSLPRAGLLVPMNKEIVKLCKKYSPHNIWPKIVANGVNTSEFRPARRMPDEFTVGAAGNFAYEYYDDWKGFSKYIVPACKKAGVKLKWCSYQGLCHSMPGHKGEMVPLDKMNEWYRDISCLVLMSKSEGCSGVTFEAQASGIPVISTKVGWHGNKCQGLRDGMIWQKRPDVETAYSIERTVDELAHKILDLKKMGKKKQRDLGMRGRAFAEKWPHSRIAEQWRPIINSVLTKVEHGNNI
jgi:glycosyltransferase involved in cell wall biosynthesis